MILNHEWEQWVVECMARGCSHEDMVKSMTAAGFSPDSASAAITGIDAARSGRQVARVFDGPGPMRFAGHDCQVLMTGRSPNMAVVAGFLSTEECALIREMAQPKLEPSRVVNNADGIEVMDSSRVSHGTYFQRGMESKLRGIEMRLADITGIPVDHGEGIQVLKYGTGGRYDPHFDFFAPELSGSQVHANAERGGQRAATVVMYLNTVSGGGDTAFPSNGLRVAAVEGYACYFSYLTLGGDLDRSSLHGGSPVVEGEKWIATWWTRVGPYVGGPGATDPESATTS